MIAPFHHSDAVAAATEESRARLGTISGRASVGLDGFVDRIFRAVDQRSKDQAIWMSQIQQLQQRLSPGHSCNVEWVLQQQRPGGNATLLALALHHLQVPTTLCATLGGADEQTIAEPLAAALRGVEQVHSCGLHATTESLEFNDGKLMLGQMGGLLDLTWSELVEKLGTAALRAFWSQSQVVCLTNWTMTPHMTEIWRQLATLGPAPDWLLIDLADPAKRADQELVEALEVLQRMPCPVLLGMNTRESARVAQLCRGDSQRGLDRARSRWPNLTFVQHSRTGASWIGERNVELGWEPLVHPKTLTGAGDHFNAGLVLGLLGKLSPMACLICAHLVAAHWIATGSEIDRQGLMHALG